MINGRLCEGAVHAKSGRQTHIQKHIRQDTRGMRGKARRADKDDESGNRRDEKTGEERITKEGRPHISAQPKWVAPQHLRCGKQRRIDSVLFQKRDYIFCIIFAERKVIIYTQHSASSLNLLVGYRIISDFFNIVPKHADSSLLPRR